MASEIPSLFIELCLDCYLVRQGVPCKAIPTAIACFNILPRKIHVSFHNWHVTLLHVQEQTTSCLVSAFHEALDFSRELFDSGFQPRKEHIFVYVRLKSGSLQAYLPKCQKLEI